jgi:hypothetical protein
MPTYTCPCCGQALPMRPDGFQPDGYVDASTGTVYCSGACCENTRTKGTQPTEPSTPPA